MVSNPASHKHADQLAHLLRGYYVAQAIYVMARLGVADLMAGSRGAGATPAVALDGDAHTPDGRMSAPQLAAATGVDPEALYRLLRALAGEGLLEEHAGWVFSLTPLGEMLRSDIPGSMRPAALIAGETQYKAWALLMDVVKHGTPAFDRIFRQPLFSFFAEHPEIHRLFNHAMTEQAVRARDAVLAACDLRDGQTVVDVGGGVGTLVIALLERHPGARGVLFESPEVIAEACERWANHAALPRLALESGDFLQRVPRGDVMLLAGICHMFQDDQALQILRHCRQSLEPAGRIYLVEKLVTVANRAEAAKWDDLNMMVMTGGRERTLEEYRSLLNLAGFDQVRQTGGNIVEGR